MHLRFRCPNGQQALALAVSTLVVAPSLRALGGGYGDSLHDATSWQEKALIVALQPLHDVVSIARLWRPVTCAPRSRGHSYFTGNSCPIHHYFYPQFCNMEDFVPPPPPQCPHIPGHLLAICVLDFEAVLSPGLLQDYILSLQIGTHFLISTYAEKLPLWALHLPAPAWAVSLLVWALLIGVALYEYWDVLLVWLGPFATAPHRQPQTPRRRSPQRAVPIDKVELLSSANAAGQSNVTPSVPTLVAYVLPSPAHVLWLGSSVATPTRRQQVATMLSPEARQLVDMTADVLMGRDDIQTPVFFLEEDKENIPLSDSSVAATRSDPFLVSSADLLDVGGALALASPGPSQWRGFLANAASPNQRLVEERHKRQVLDSYEVRYTSGSHSERVGAVRDEEVQHSETPRLSVLQMALKYEADRGRDAKGKGKAVEPSAAQLGAVKATIQAWAVDPPTLRNVQAWEMLRPEEDFVSGIVVPAAQMLTIDEILNERR